MALNLPPDIELIADAIFEHRPDIIVVIPACDEDAYIGSCLESLCNCKLLNFNVTILTVINHGYLTASHIKDSNLKTLQILKSINDHHNNLQIVVSYPTEGINGVGSARKWGMDIAKDAFKKQVQNGIIVCLDADCTVEKNYFVEIWSAFSNNLDKYAASIYFEHPIHHENIIRYELHLRYFIDIQRWLGLPYAYQTVGSAMAVRSEAYTAMGGMNKRQAGEDFYFLHKFISIGRCFEINATCVYPSARKSDRVPFGTGKAMKNIESNKGEMKTYHPDNFEIVRDFCYMVMHTYQDSNFNLEKIKPLEEWLAVEKFDKKLVEIKEHTSNFESFKKRFFQWFEAFKLMKCLHHLRSHREDIPVLQATNSYCQKRYGTRFDTALQALEYLRMIAKKETNF